MDAKFHSWYALGVFEKPDYSLILSYVSGISGTVLRHRIQPHIISSTFKGDYHFHVELDSTKRNRSINDTVVKVLGAHNVKVSYVLKVLRIHL